MFRATQISLGITEFKDPLVGALRNLRESRSGPGDEILLNSTGPVTDLSMKSLLPCLLRH